MLRIAGFAAIIFFLSVFLLLLIGYKFLPSTAVTATSTVLSGKTPLMFTNTSPPILEETSGFEAPTNTPTSIIAETPIAIPLSQYNSLFSLDKRLEVDGQNPLCGSNSSNASPFSNEALYRRDDLNWGFEVDVKRTTDDIIQTNFSKCSDDKKIAAIEVSAIVNRLEIPEYQPGREFGIFLENNGGQRREYTIWVDKTNTMYLRVRIGASLYKDYPILVVSPGMFQFGGEYPRKYIKFPIRFFLEIDNEGFDIMYLLEGSYDEKIGSAIFDPTEMIQVEAATLPTLDSIQEIGLVGRGGKTETLIWSLKLLQRK